ncbi:hypothetical protein M8J76_013751 [Diaphorina citri]|nr:hypothetical protein M8J76_013751 [Diaphorina citri]
MWTIRRAFTGEECKILSTREPGYKYIIDTMVSPGPRLAGSVPTTQIVKWTLPITLLVTVLGFWWHSRKKKKPDDGDTDGTKDRQCVKDRHNGSVKSNGVAGKNSLAVESVGEVQISGNPDLNAFIETVQRLNSGALEPSKELTNGCVPNGHAPCNGSVVIPKTPPSRQRSAPQPCTPQSTPRVEQVLAKSVKYLESSKSMLDSLEFGVAEVEPIVTLANNIKNTSPAKKTWSELVEEDSSADESSAVIAGKGRRLAPRSAGVSASEEELQFSLEGVVSSSSGLEPKRGHQTVARLVSCDSTTVDSSTLSSNSPQDYHNTKSHSESEANAEVSNIIHTTAGATAPLVADSEAGGHTARDSANHSPSTEEEAMVTSPSLSDVHSEGSSDSGKGCSEASRTPAGGSSVSGEPPSLLSTAPWAEHCFVLPQNIVGRLIGKGGQFIHRVRSLTHTKIYIKRHPHSHKLKICAVEGTQPDIDQALSMIRQKFPVTQYPFLTLEKLPSHPSYASLESLNLLMNTTYASAQAPLLPAPVENALVAAPAMGGWFRAQILAVDVVNASCQVKFVDYGGYLTLETSALRQIRADFLSLPFQAIECGLANIVPVTTDGDSTEAEWTEEARTLVHGLTSGHILQAQVYDYECESQIPLVVLVNQELVERGYAKLDAEAANLVATTNSEITAPISTPATDADESLATTTGVDAEPITKSELSGETLAPPPSSQSVPTSQCNAAGSALSPASTRYSRRTYSHGDGTFPGGTERWSPVDGFSRPAYPVRYPTDFRSLGSWFAPESFPGQSSLYAEQDNVPYTRNYSGNYSNRWRQTRPYVSQTYSNSYNPYNEVCSFNNNGLCVEDSANTSSYSRDYQDNKNARDRREIDSKEGNGSYKRSGYSYSHTEEKTDGDQETDFYNQSDSGGFPSVNSYPYRSYNRKSRYSTPGMYLRGSYEPTGSPFSAPTSYYYGDSYSPSLLGSCVGDSGECPTPSVWLRFPSPSG